MFRQIARFVLTALLIALSPGYARAQAVLGGTVSGRGTVKLRPVPTALRMQMQFRARGSTAEKALARLKDRRQGVAEKLKTLGADVQTIAFGPPSLRKIAPFDAPAYSVPMPYPSTGYPPGPGTSLAPALPPAPTYRGPAPVYSPQSPMARAPQPYAPPSSRPRRVEVPSAFTASATLTVDWSLQGDGLEQVLIAAEALKEKILAADLKNIGAPENLSTDELQAEEIAEEAAGRTRRYVPVTTFDGGTTGPYESVRWFSWGTTEPDAAQFLFVATISPQERKAAMAEAFAKAEANARELVEAAGKQLGPLAGLTGWAGDGSLVGYQGDVPARGFSYVVPPTAVFSARQPLEEPKENEVVGLDPRRISFYCRVSATFRLP